MAVLAQRQAREAGVFRGLPRGQDPRERILVLRAPVGAVVLTQRQAREAGVFRGLPRGQDPRERILALRTTGRTE
jgi:hypothetical protein